MIKHLVGEGEHPLGHALVGPLQGLRLPGFRHRAGGPRAARERGAREEERANGGWERGPGGGVALALCGEGFGTSRGIAEEAKARTQEEAYPVLNLVVLTWVRSSDR